MNSTQKKRWFLDATLFIGFLGCFFPDATGVVLHQVLGIAAGLAAGTHLLTHWSWVCSVTQRFFGKTSSRARLYFTIDALVMAGFFTILATGLVISTWVNLSLTNYAAWQTVHIAASISTLVLLVLKIGLHARWIAATARKVFAPRVVQTQEPIPALATTGMTRRDFLKVMGAAGAVSMIALSSSAKGLLNALGEFEDAGSSTPAASNITTAAPSTSTPAGVVSNTPAPLSSSSASTGSSTITLQSGNSAASINNSSTCIVRCNRGCSYPGKCRRYVDSNGNGLCDNGECMS